MTTPEKLASALADMYRDARPGELSIAASLFGIRYAEQIRACGVSYSELVRLSGIADERGRRRSYDREISKGVKLAGYVVPRATGYDL